MTSRRIAELVVLIQSEMEPFIGADMRRWWSNRCVKVTRGGETFFKVDTPKRFRCREGVKRLASFGVKARVALRAVTLAAVLFALPLRAQYPSDQQYLPIVVYAPPYRTEITVTNTSPDRVSISLLFTRANTPDNDPNRPLQRATRDAYRLAPLESRVMEIGDFGISGQGLLVVNGCKEDGFCSPSIDLSSTAIAPRYHENLTDMRPVSVSERVYFTNATGGTRGASLTATPWYDLPSADMAPLGLDRVAIPYIRNDAHYTTRIGLVNGSQFSATFVTATLRDGLGVERGRWTERLEPLLSADRSVAQMFPLAFGATNRANRQPPLNSPWVEVVQGEVMPNELAKSMIGCENGCGRFMAYASVTDSLSLDFSLIPGTPEVGDRSRTSEPSQVLARGLSIALKSTPPAALTARIADPLRFTFKGPTCSIEPNALMLGDYILRQRIPGTDKYGPPWTHVGFISLPRMREMCGAAVGQ